jgi:microcystin-dependent protein
MPGELKAFAGSSVPSWAEGQWLLCDGSAVSRTAYASLFEAIGETWGVGDGATTFNLPDLRGRALVGLDNMGGVAANRVTASGSGIDGTALGAAGGAETHVLTSNEMPAHRHHAFANVDGTGSLNNLSSTNQACKQATVNGVPDFEYVVQGTDADATLGRTSSAGGSGGHNNMQPSAMVNYLIKT